jgi:hypothetical protein
MGYHSQQSRGPWAFASSTGVKRSLVVAGVLVTFFGLLFTFLHQEPSSRNYLSSTVRTGMTQLTGKGDNLRDVYNETLGVSAACCPLRLDHCSCSTQ